MKVAVTYQIENLPGKFATTFTITPKVLCEAILLTIQGIVQEYLNRVYPGIKTKILEIAG